MLKFENLMICLNLTEMDDYLIRYSIYLVDAFKAESVTFIHVMDNYKYPEELSEAFSEDEEKSLEEIYEKLGENYNPDHAVKPNAVIEDGHTVERIIRYANKNRIDLAVLGKKIDYEGEVGVVIKIIGLIKH